MFSKTSLSALRSLLLLAQKEPGTCLSHRVLAEELGESPTYMAKVVRHLVKSGILEADKGVKGGVRLLRAPEEVTLLSVIESCQGTIVGDFCRSGRPAAGFCGFHRAALELHEAITGVLERWTLADVLRSPAGTTSHAACLMRQAFVAVGAAAAPRKTGAPLL